MPELFTPLEDQVIATSRTFIQTHIPEFLDYIEIAQQDAKPIALVIDGFETATMRARVQACLWYAVGAGVPLTISLEKAPSAQTL